MSEKERIWEKSSGLCWYCGKQAEQIDHVIPRFLGGPNTFENKVPVCKWCNKSKRGYSLDQWRLKRAIQSGMTFTSSQREFWSRQGIVLPPDKTFIFFFEGVLQ